jgi:GGDEF domain-containing protein
MKASNETDNLLAVFHCKREDLNRIIEAYDKFPSVEFLLTELTNFAAKKLSLNEGQLTACQDLISASVRHDPITRLYDGNFDQLIVTAANSYSQSNNVESYIIEGDFSNLYNCNKVIGKSQTNKIMDMIIDIYQQEFKAISPGSTYGSRIGGDEFRFIITGINEAELKEATKNAQGKIDSLVESLGLSNLEHSKYPDNHIKKGIGANIAYKKLPVEFPSYKLQVELDQAVDKNKYQAGKDKLEKSKTMGKPQIIDKVQDFTKTRHDQISLNIEKYKDKKPHLKTTLKNQDFPFKDIAADENEQNIFKIRQAQIKQLSSKLNFNNEQNKFLMDILEYVYDKKDDKTGMMSNKDFITSLTNYHSYSKSKNLSCFLLKMEAYNFSSLNAIFSHAGNDTMFKHMAKIVEKNLNDLEPICFHRGGGIITAITPEISAKKIDAAIARIADDFIREIGKKTIKEYCNEQGIPYLPDGLAKLNINENTKINNIPSIRGASSGSGFILHKQNLKNVVDFTEALNNLDQKVDTNKAKGVACKADGTLYSLNGTKIKLDKFSLSTKGSSFHTPTISNGMKTRKAK